MDFVAYKNNYWDISEGYCFLHLLQKLCFQFLYYRQMISPDFSWLGATLETMLGAVYAPSQPWLLVSQDNTQHSVNWMGTVWVVSYCDFQKYISYTRSASVWSQGWSVVTSSKAHKLHCRSHYRDQLCFAPLWHWTPESWDTSATSSQLGSASAQDLVGNRTTMGLINKPCDSIHTTGYALDLVFVLALGEKVMDKLTLSWVEDRVMDLFVFIHRLTIPGEEMGLMICKKSVNLSSKLPRNTWLAIQKCNTPLG